LPREYWQWIHIFAPTHYVLAEHGPYDFAINLKPDSKLPRQKQRPKTREQSLEIIRQVTEWKRLRRIRESRSDSAVDTLFVPKHDGTLRMCIDYRPLNAAVYRDENKAPLQEQVKDRVQGAKWFTKLDIRDGYHRLRIRKGDEKYTAFLTPIGLFELKVMWFGFANAPAEFARFMMHILDEFIERFVVVYFDDITIYSRTLEEHRDHVAVVLKRLSDEKITLKISKCEFHKQEIELLGERISGTAKKMLEEKLNAIVSWPEPKCLKDIERWRGLAGYYRQYIEGFSKRIEPLNRVLKAKVFVWMPEQQEAFNDLKTCFRKGQILLIFDYEKPVRLVTDASGIALGGVIEQQDEQGRWKPVLFYSRKFNDAELRYSTPDKELLAIVQMFRKFPHYLKGTKFPVVVKSDHKNLRTFTTKKKLLGRQVGWMEELSDANFVIEHIRGKENVVADALSRHPDYQKNGEEQELAILTEKNGSLVMTASITANLHDEGMIELLQEIAKATDALERPQEAQFTEADGLRSYGGKWFVPPKCEDKVFDWHHKQPKFGHPGAERLIHLIERWFYMPKIVRKARAYVRKCDDCQRNKESRHKPYGYMKSQAEYMELWSDLTMDFMEGIPKVTCPLTKKVYDEILVVVDRLSKFSILIPVWKNLTAEQLATVLMREVFRWIGFPKRIISDRDKLFRSEMWQKIAEDMGIHHKMSTSNHQQTDGQSEKKIQEIIVWFRHYLDFNQENWLKLLPVLQSCLNNMESATTGRSPNEIVFGVTSRIEYKGDKDTDWNTGIWEAKQLREAVLLEINWEREQQAIYYNRRRKDAPSLKVGDRVYLKRRTAGSKVWNIKSLRPSQKLDHVKYGPFAIEEVQENDNYKLRLPSRMKIYPIFHVSLLEPTEIQETGENDALAEDEFEVEKIVDKTVENGETLYKVRWMGCTPDEDTWEPTKHLSCPAKIEEFERTQGTPLRKK
jgi:hypothetical protein